MQLTSVLAQESGHTRELPVDPIVFGLIGFGLLLVMLLGVLMFGKGRPHS